MANTAKVLLLSEDFKLIGKGREAIEELHFGRTVNVCAPQFGADPTGVKDSTPAIQAAIDWVHSQGGGVVIIPGGDFRVNATGLQMRGYVAIRGQGRFVTRIWLDASTVTADTVETGVFHTGSYGKRIEDPSFFRTSIVDLSIQSTFPDGSMPRSGKTAPFQHIGPSNVQSKIWGIVYNTFLGSGPAEPDSVHYIDNIEIWDMAGGVAMLGLDDQGCQISNIRIRHTWKQCVLAGKPGDHPEAFEVNPSDPTKSIRRSGAADNHWINIDASSANLSLAGYAGFEINTSQNVFTQCKSWYVRRGLAGYADLKGTLPTGDTPNIFNFAATQGTLTPGVSNPDGDPKRFVKDGAGFYINGRDNVFIGSTSQETGGHGWVVHGSSNQIIGCFGESPSFYDCVKGDALVNEAVGFLFTNWCQGTQATSCISKNAYKSHKDARLGFYVQGWTSKLTLRDCKTLDMPFANGVDAEAGELEVYVPPATSLGEQVSVDVNDFHFSNFTRDTVGSGAGGAGGAAFTAPASTPAEVQGLIAHWDFSETSTMTVNGNKVEAVSSLGGAAPSGTLTQAVSGKRPTLSALGSLSAIKLKREFGEHLVAADIGPSPISGGWSIAMVVAMNAKTEGQYLYSSFGNKAAEPASITVNSKLAFRPNSGGGSKGYTTKTPDNAAQLYTPAVLIVTVNSAGVNVWLDGNPTPEAPTMTGPTMGLIGKAAIGAYADGTSSADATIGEVALFAKTLTPEQVDGLTTYLRRKWA